MVTYGQDYNMLDFSQSVFSAVVLIVSAGVTAHMFHGYSNKKWRSTFIGLVLLLLMATQVYYLLQAALHVPTYPYRYDSSLLRLDCLDSGKGGKRSRNSVQGFDLNPCFNYSNSDPVTLENATDGTQFISHKRDCHGGFGASCSQEEPCTPCSREALPLWGAGRCRACTASFRGNCNFVPGVGPYCLEAPGSKVVVPCTRCCTEAAALIVNGTCY
mmetsp:Transcript_8655/g.14681  ORF Transcript_8655/g.14681 Transcript_8655/m.14681 type:complete len:215 (-) Transcript_8655:145-789(-)